MTEGDGTRPIVLFVDDEQQVLDGFARAFHGEVFELRFARDFREALWVLNGESVAVIVSDEGMPGMNGARLLRMLRRTFPSVRRIMLTGAACQEIGADALKQANVFRYLRKPCSPETLLTVLYEALELSPADEFFDNAPC